ncbi:Os07g0537550 [Oryza sativa Japonica Group]|uniref:Os07g0537550 protein n=1 Tax=Oryza sativa subsp. japonica TaxID=39947 RepID=A0A0P0X704_ORYSJ|nr:hypothetical protein EE612_039777 [Oryza sativa]BAT01932.1 Os07g0537550 [Oryza sativa Japonica Group]
MHHHQAIEEGVYLVPVAAPDSKNPAADAVREQPRQLGYDGGEAVAALRRRQVRRALRPAVHLGELRLPVEDGLAGRVPAGGVVRGVVGGGVHQRRHHAVEPARVRRDVLQVDAARRGGVVDGGEEGDVGVVEDARVVVDGGVLVVGAHVLHVLERRGEAAGALRGVGVPAAQRQRRHLLRHGAHHGGREEVRRRRDVPGQRRRDGVEVGLVRAVGREVARRAAHLPRVRRATRRQRQQHDGGGEQHREAASAMRHGHS